MEFKQNDRERLLDMVEQGKITADDANVLKVRTQRVFLAIGRVPANVRKALNAAVKRGELGHMKKDGGKPEAYYHPTFEYLAVQERSRAEQEQFRALAKVIARPYEE